MTSAEHHQQQLFPHPGDQIDLFAETDVVEEVEDEAKEVDDGFLADLQPTINSLFSVWSSGSEAEWVAYAWATLASHGLADCSTLTARARSLCRLAALAIAYRETCARYLDDGSSGEWRYRIRDLLGDEYPLLHPFSLGLLCAEEGRGTDDSSGPEWEDIDIGDYLAAIVAGEYDVVTRILLADWEASEVVATIIHSASWDASFPVDPDVRDVIVNHPTAGTMSAYMWVSEGMPLCGHLWEVRP